MSKSSGLTKSDFRLIIRDQYREFRILNGREPNRKEKISFRVLINWLQGKHPDLIDILLTKAKRIQKAKNVVNRSLWDEFWFSLETCQYSLTEENIIELRVDANCLPLPGHVNCNSAIPFPISQVAYRKIVAVNSVEAKLRRERLGLETDKLEPVEDLARTIRLYAREQAIVTFMRQDLFQAIPLA